MKQHNARAEDAWGDKLIAGTVSSKWRKGSGVPAGDETHNMVVGTLCAKGKAAGSAVDQDVDQGHLILDSLTPFDTTQLTSPGNRSNPQPGDPAPTLASHAHAPAIAFNARQDPDSWPQVNCLDTDGHSIGIGIGNSVRRLTPRECERLQGYPDDYTRIPVKKVRRSRLASPRAKDSYIEVNGEVWQLASDGPRYEAIGNGMATPVMRWIGERIELVEAIA